MLKLVGLEKGQKGRLPEAVSLRSQELQDRLRLAMKTWVMDICCATKIFRHFGLFGIFF